MEREWDEMGWNSWVGATAATKDREGWKAILNSKEFLQYWLFLRRKIEEITWNNDVTIGKWKSVITICCNKKAGFFCKVTSCFDKFMETEMLVKCTNNCSNLKDDKRRNKLQA